MYTGFFSPIHAKEHSRRVSALCFCLFPAALNFALVSGDTDLLKRALFITASFSGLIFIPYWDGLQTFRLLDFFTLFRRPFYRPAGRPSQCPKSLQSTRSRHNRTGAD